MNRLYELENSLQGAVNNIVPGENPYIWSFVERWLYDLLNEPTIMPVTITVINYGRTNPNGVTQAEYMVKAKGTSTKLFNIVLEIDAQNCYWYNASQIKSVEINAQTSMIYDLSSFMDYCADRQNRLANQQDKKIAPFKNELNAAGIDTATFVKLYNMYNNLDAPSRRTLYREGTKN